MGKKELEETPAENELDQFSFQHLNPVQLKSMEERGVLFQKPFFKMWTNRGHVLT